MKFGISLIPNQDSLINIIYYKELIFDKTFPDNLIPRLSLINNLPHLTLLQFEANNSLKENNFQEIYDILIKIKESSIYHKTIIEKFNFNLLDFTSDNWIFLKNSNEDNFKKIHLKLFDLLKNHITPPSKKNESYNLFYSSLEKKYYDLYGYRYIKENYQPHITIGKLPISYFLEKYQNSNEKKNEFKKIILNQLQENDLNIEFNNIIFHKLGDYGICNEIIFK
jgi:hypothetical protein